LIIDFNHALETSRERPRGRPRIRWKDQIHEDIRRIGLEDWRGKIQDRPGQKPFEKLRNTAE
jgi:hypothetical protein